MDGNWQALAREASSAAEHLAFGVTALGRANYAQTAYYTQAFFALSIGFERCGKLALVVDHALEHGGEFPSARELRDYGHRLDKLLSLTEQIGTKRQAGEVCPSTAIHQAIIEILSNFATNVTRYYNLEFIAGDAAAEGDPIATWYQRVTTPILDLHYKDRHRRRHETNAQFGELLLGDVALVRHHSETGENITTIYDGALQAAQTEFAKPWERMYVLQIVRFVGSVLGQLGFLAQVNKVPSIPYFSEMFAMFNNADTYLRARKTWSIYKP